MGQRVAADCLAECAILTHEHGAVPLRWRGEGNCVEQQKCGRRMGAAWRQMEWAVALVPGNMADSAYSVIPMCIPMRHDMLRYCEKQNRGRL